MNSNELFAKIIALAIPHSSHASDLYIPKTEQTIKLIKEYEFEKSVTLFISQIDKTVWYDVPFCYIPFWEKVGGNG